MTSSRPFPPLITGWSPLQRSSQPLRPWLADFWQATSHHPKQFAYLCAAKHIGQLAFAHSKRQTHEAITHLIHKIACLNTKGQLSALHPPLPNPHVVIAVDRNWANATCSKFAAMARDALLRLTHVPRPSPPQVGLKPRSRKACLPSELWASKSRSSMAAAKKPARADPSSLATSVGQAGNATSEPAALNQRAAHAATSAGHTPCNGGTCARRDSSSAGTIPTGLPATDCLDTGSGMTTAPSPAQRITSSKLVVKPGRAKSTCSMRHAQEEIARLVMGFPLHHFRHLPWLRLLHADFRRREVIRPEAMQRTSLHQHSRHEHAHREHDPEKTFTRVHRHLPSFVERPSPCTRRPGSSSRIDRSGNGHRPRASQQPDCCQ